MGDRQNGYGMSVTISLHLLKRKSLKENNTMHLGVRKTPRAEQPCWVFAAHHTIILFVTKIT